MRFIAFLLRIGKYSIIVSRSIQPLFRNSEEVVRVYLCRNPVALSCTHRFCFSCIATLAAVSSNSPPPPDDIPDDMMIETVVKKSMQFDCPVCRKTQVFDEGNVWVDSHLGELVNRHRTSKGEVQESAKEFVDSDLRDA
eukprot:4014224-Pyramimonas_sp.AAC.1